MGVAATGGEAEPARGQRLAQQGPHQGYLVVVGLVADGVVAHDRPAQGAMPHQEAGVHAHPPALDGPQVVGEALPVPRHALLQGGQLHALDLHHHALEVLAVFGASEGGEREAAVSADHGGDAEQVRRGGPGIPEDLGVVVGVGIDEARAHDQALGVDRVGGVGVGVGEVARVGHGHYPAAVDADVGWAGRRAGAVDQRPAGDQRVEHCGGRASGRIASSMAQRVAVAGWARSGWCDQSPL